MRDVLTEIDRRKEPKDDPCDSCDATGLVGEKVCSDCLGQGILLTRDEYDYLLSLSDLILDAEILEV